MHDIVFLWSHPRSLSSAMERVMVERGDLRVLHEPFLYLYYVGEARKPLPHFTPQPQHPTRYAAIRRMILAAAEQGPVFVKDMCYYVADRVCADEPFLRRIKHSFLIRDPAPAIASYYKLDPGVSLEEVGLERQWQVFERVMQLQGAAPPLIDAADLRRDPPATLRAYCAALGLEHRPQALSWDDPLPADWQFVAGWHAGVAASSGIAPEPREAVAPDLGADPKLAAFLAHHLPYYQRLYDYRLVP